MHKLIRLGRMNTPTVRDLNDFKVRSILPHHRVWMFIVYSLGLIIKMLQCVFVTINKQKQNIFLLIVPNIHLQQVN